ncbi:hypothetical protein [Enterococcus sp.]|nr:hypothetical protein [Enterococcus sp.]
MKKIAVFSSILGIGILIGAAALVLQNKQTNEDMRFMLTIILMLKI